MSGSRRDLGRKLMAAHIGMCRVQVEATETFTLVVRSAEDAEMALRNIQIIDGAENCAYDIFAAEDHDFMLIFPEPKQNIEFSEDFVDRVGEEMASEIFSRLWRRPVDKKTVTGIHGTLFFGLINKKKYYPSKRDSEAIANP